MRPYVRSLIGIAITAAIVFGCSSEKKDAAMQKGSGDQSASQQPNQAPSPSSNSNAVQFAAMDIDGHTRQSTEWVTKQPVIINFWGTWCPPCRKEIPDLVKFYEEYKAKGIEIVSLAVNDNPDAVRAYSSNAGMKWVMLMGEDGIYEKYGGVRGVPTTIFIDRSGKETDRFVGARTYEDFKAAADKIL